jgi:hypothetical protein
LVSNIPQAIWFGILALISFVIMLSSCGHYCQGFKSLPLHFFYFTGENLGENALNEIVAKKRDLNLSI